MPVVITVSGQVESMIIKTRLEAENIPVHLSYESSGPVYGFSSTNLGKVQVMVPKAFENAARHICKTTIGESSGPASPEDSDNRAA